MIRNIGYNPLRWNCLSRGCFNFHKRPKIEEFAECLPGKSGFADIDAITEIGGYFLLMEWKDGRGAVQVGQSIMLKEMAKTGRFTSLIVVGQTENMKVQEIKIYNEDGISDWMPCNLSELKNYVRNWATRAAPKRK